MKTGRKVKNFYDLYDSRTKELLYSCVTAAEIANYFCVPAAQVRTSCKRGYRIARRYSVVKSNNAREDAENNLMNSDLEAFKKDWYSTCSKLHSILVKLGISIKIKGCKEID